MAPPEETKDKIDPGEKRDVTALPTPDIAGTQAHALEGWQEITEKLAKPEFFKVSINPSIELLKQLDNPQKVRLFKKLKLVSKAAQYMAAGMTKGTVKYATDDYDLKQWFAHLIGEGADQMCYQMLLFEAWHRLEEAERLAGFVVGQPVEAAVGEDANYVVEQDGKVIGGSANMTEGGRLPNRGASDDEILKLKDEASFTSKDTGGKDEGVDQGEDAKPFPLKTFPQR